MGSVQHYWLKKDVCAYKLQYSAVWLYLVSKENNSVYFCYECIANGKITGKRKFTQT